jgi:predicted ArsR family transcriptional regulator
LLANKAQSVTNTFRIKDLHQVHLLSDPLKLRLLQAFAEGAKTTKQAAVEIGASVTRLYRHVDALQAAGLLEIVDEKQKRGTVERTFRAVADRFEADATLFLGGPDDDVGSSIRDLLRAGEDDIMKAIIGAAENGRQDPIVMRLRGEAMPARIAALRQSLAAWIESAQDGGESDAGPTEQFGALIAFYVIGKES